jgi:hypothetical protein
MAYEEVVRVEQLEAEEGEDDLDRPAATIHKVAVEEVRVGRRWQPVERKDVCQVEELPVHVAAQGDLSVHEPATVPSKQAERA